MLDILKEYEIEKQETKHDLMVNLLSETVLLFLRPLIAYLLYGAFLEPYYNLPPVGYWQWFSILWIAGMIFGKVTHDRR